MPGSTGFSFGGVTETGRPGAGVLVLFFLSTRRLGRTKKTEASGSSWTAWTAFIAASSPDTTIRIRRLPGIPLEVNMTDGVACLRWSHARWDIPSLDWALCLKVSEAVVRNESHTWAWWGPDWRRLNQTHGAEKDKPSRDGECLG